MAGNNAIKIDAADNVVTLTVAIAKGDTVSWVGGEIVAETDVPEGHKVAIAPIEGGTAVLKYGHPIGKAAGLIEAGHHVHSHNLAKEGEG